MSKSLPKEQLEVARIFRMVVNHEDRVWNTAVRACQKILGSFAPEIQTLIKPVRYGKEFGEGDV